MRPRSEKRERRLTFSCKSIRACARAKRQQRGCVSACVRACLRLSVLCLARMGWMGRRCALPLPAPSFALFLFFPSLLSFSLLITFLPSPAHIAFHSIHPSIHPFSPDRPLQVPPCSRYSLLTSLPLLPSFPPSCLHSLRTLVTFSYSPLTPPQQAITPPLAHTHPTHLHPLSHSGHPLLLKANRLHLTNNK